MLYNIEEIKQSTGLNVIEIKKIKNNIILTFDTKYGPSKISYSENQLQSIINRFKI